MQTTGNWRVSANCRVGDPDRLFVTGAKQREARAICRGCPVLTECLAHALNERIEFGVWGGMTERERRAMLRRRPDVTCWERFLRDAARRMRAKQAANQPVPEGVRGNRPVAERSSAKRPVAERVAAAKPLSGGSVTGKAATDGAGAGRPLAANAA